jgi:hypothetical protein
LEQTEAFGCFLDGDAFEVAQDNGQAIFFGKLAQFFIENRPQFVPGIFGLECGLGAVGHRLFPHVSLDSSRTRFAGGFFGHAVKPIADFLAWLDALGIAGQNEKRRLKGIFGIVMVGQDPPADAPNHWPMTLHQRPHGRLFASAYVTFEKLSVANSRRSAAQHRFAQQMDDLFQRMGGHDDTMGP